MNIIKIVSNDFFGALSLLITRIIFFLISKKKDLIFSITVFFLFQSAYENAGFIMIVLSCYFKYLSKLSIWVILSYLDNVSI